MHGEGGGASDHIAFYENDQSTLRSKCVVRGILRLGGRLDQATHNCATITPDNLGTLIWINYVGEWSSSNRALNAIFLYRLLEPNFVPPGFKKSGVA